MHWVVGDIHGMHRAVARLIDAVLADDPSAHLIFAGDYINRGPDSRQVIDRMLQLPNATFLRGNHDDVFDLILHGQGFALQPDGTDRGWAYQWFMNYGLDSTLYSYGVDWDWARETAGDPTPQRLSQLALLIPPEHRAFIRNLVPVYESEMFFVVHGCWPVQRPSLRPTIKHSLEREETLRHTALWGRYTIEEIRSTKSWHRRGFVGHTPVHSYSDVPQPADAVPLLGPNLVLLDTAAALVPWGRLTAFCVEENRFLQTTPTGERVPS